MRKTYLRVRIYVSTCTKNNDIYVYTWSRDGMTATSRSWVKYIYIYWFICIHMWKNMYIYICIYLYTWSRNGMSATSRWWVKHVYVHVCVYLHVQKINKHIYIYTWSRNGMSTTSRSWVKYVYVYVYMYLHVPKKNIYIYTYMRDPETGWARQADHGQIWGVRGLWSYLRCWCRQVRVAVCCTVLECGVVCYRVM